jgi:hypothetical protein
MEITTGRQGNTRVLGTVAVLTATVLGGVLVPTAALAQPTSVRA